MRFLPSLALLAALATPAAFADTVTLNSVADGSIYYGSTLGANSGTAVGFQDHAYATPLAGSAWISSDGGGGNGSNTDTFYTQTFNLLGNENYTGSVSYYVDNSAGIYVNGVNVLANPYVYGGSFYTNGNMETFNFASSSFHAGVNTLTFDVYNGNGPQGVDYSAHLTGTALAPEPNSLILLGTGILGFAGALRRRVQAYPLLL